MIMIYRQIPVDFLQFAMIIYGAFSFWLGGISYTCFKGFVLLKAYINGF
jgi:hypothetical protein